MTKRTGGPDTPPLEGLCHPVAAAVDRFRREDVPYVKIHRLVDAYEVLVKYLVSVLVFEAQATEPEENRAALRGLFAASVLRPSLGHWLGYLRGLLAPKDPPRWRMLEDETISGVAKAFGGRQGDFNDFVTLRNAYGHGAVAAGESCLRDVERFAPRLDRVIAAVRPVLELPLYSRAPEKGRFLLWRGPSQDAVLASSVGSEGLPGASGLASPFVTRGGRAVSLFPLMYMPEEPLHFFYNSVRDLGKGRIDFLNYDRGVHHEDRGRVAPEFLVHFPQEDEGPADPTRERRLEYLAGFVGRERELRRMLEFVAKRDRGLFMLWGAPGVGKGALMSRFAAELESADHAALGDEGLASGLARFSGAIRFPYLLLQEDADGARFLRAAVPCLARGLGIRRPEAGDVRPLLDEASRRGTPVVLVIDGLDEVVRSAGGRPELLNAIPSRVPAGCYVVLSSRPVPEARAFWSGVDPKNSVEFTLEGITADDVREIICREHSKYDVLTEHLGFVERLYEASLGADGERGNPLYVKLAADELREGRLALGDEAGIPRGLTRMYEGFLERIAKAGPDALDVLYVAAAAKRPLSAHQIARILPRDEDVTRAQIASVHEMLQQTEEPGEVAVYTVFHKSMTDFLRGDRPEKLARFEGRLLAYSRTWRDLASEYRGAAERGQAPLARARQAAAYAFHHLGDHLLEAMAEGRAGAGEKDSLLEELVAAIDDREFRELTFELCGTVAPLRRAIEGAQRLLAEGDEGGRNLGTVVRFALYYADEWERFQLEASERLPEAARSGNWARALALAEMSQTERGKVFAAMRALRAFPEGIDPRAREAVDGRVKEWLRAQNDPTLEECWREVSARAAAKALGGTDA